MENKFKFLTKYSLSKKLKNKWFIIANVIVAIILICLVNIDSIIKLFGGDFDSTLNIKIMDNAGYYEEIKDNLKEVSKSFSDSKVVIKKEEKNEKDAKKSLKGTKDILLVINEDEDNVFNVKFISDSYVDAIKYQSIVSSLNSVKSKIALENSGMNQEELEKINKAVTVKRGFVDKNKTENEENARTLLSFASLIIALPCFILIMFLVQMIGAEINEEKSTRGMEIIIGNVSAKAHFFSKIVSSNLFVILQSILIVFYGLIGVLIRKMTTTSTGGIASGAASSFNLSQVVDMIGKSGIMDKLSSVIILIIILVVLSFLAYSLLAGILASMTTNMENYQQLQTPLMIISVIGCYLILISSAFPGSMFIKIASVIPLISISLAPSLILCGEISINTLIVAILIVGLLDYVLLKYGLRVYKVGILNYSETNLWKKMFKAAKEK